MSGPVEHNADRRTGTSQFGREQKRSIKVITGQTPDIGSGNQMRGISGYQNDAETESNAMLLRIPQRHRKSNSTIPD